MGLGSDLDNDLWGSGTPIGLVRQAKPGELG
jgi:hypothetical protein